MKKNQTVLITGASSGIGEHLVHCFARNGFKLVLVARRESKLKDIASDVKKQYGVEVVVYAADLNDTAAPRQLFQKLDTDNCPVHILVNNAGFGEHGYFADTNLAKELAMLQVNVVAVVHLSKLFLGQLPAGQPGKILNVASTAAFFPGPLMSVYFATKAFILSFSEALANELTNRNVTVTALCPGPTQTNFQMNANMEDSGLVARNMASAESVAQAGYDGLMAGKTVVIPGLKNKLLTFGSRLMPRNLVAKIVRKIQEKR